MEWLEFAEKKPVNYTNQTMRRSSPSTLILHSAVGSKWKWDNNQPQTLHKHFLTNPLESHFFVDKDGRIEQYVPLTHTADANYYANRWAVSVETADDGDPDRTPWTTDQIDSIARIAAHLNTHNGLPLDLTRHVEDSGINGHTSHGAPSKWTPVVKSCPGAARKQQIPTIIAKAKKLTKQPAVKPIDYKPIDTHLRQGSKSEMVKSLQKYLGLTQDGDYGPITAAAVKGLQIAYGLKPDGIVGPVTQKAIDNPKPWTPSKVDWMPLIDQTSMTLATLLIVKSWQAYLNIPASGKYNPLTQAATKGWQKGAGLLNDGILGPITWGTALNYK